jgi:TetR/AcrR family transcriptional regulator, transcriptional repressor for nem operon
MPRPREFDYERAVARATRLFWAKGYSGTSLRDLLKAMGIGESSFYNAVGSKKALYLACLKHYNDVVTRRRLQALDSAGPVGRAVRRFFTCVLDELDDPKTPRVCLMAGSLSTEVLADGDLERYVVGEMRTFQDAFVARMERGQASGELPARYPSTASAQVLVTYLQGLFRVIRVLNTRREVEGQLDSLLRGLGL